jgi:dephospho-CoA kinase
MSKPYLVAITGGIGSGKTTVVNIFQELGVPAYIADERAKSLMENDKGMIEKIKNLFGEQSYIDGKLNRSFISEMVFGDKAKLQKLNNIVHPAVRENFELWAKQQKAQYVIYESALIFQHDQESFFDDIILITAPEDERIKRVKKRSGLDENDIKKRINQQMPDKLKKEKVNHIIDNVNIYELKDIVNKINLKILNKIREIG